MINTEYILPVLVLVIVAVALLRRINAYHSFTEGVKDGMKLFHDIYPALLSMMCAISLLRQSGLMDMLCSALAAHIANIPKEIWPMVIFRPISGSASLAVLVDIFQVCGVDSLAGNMASIIQGSTDTTVYVITLYFSSVGIRRIKNALAFFMTLVLAGCAVVSLCLLYTYDAGDE